MKMLLCDKCAMRPVLIVALEEDAIRRRASDDGDGESTLAPGSDSEPSGEVA